MEWNLWPIVQFTFWQSSLVTLFSILLGGGLAVLERRYHSATPRWFIVICSLPLFLPPLIVGTGFIQLLGQAGDVNTVLGWLQLPTIQFLYQPKAVILAHLYYNIPLAYLAVRASLARVSAHTEEAAQVVGANSWHIWTYIWWPQLKSTFAGIGAVIFLYCWTSFTLPLQLGGSKAKTVEVWIYEQIKLYHQPELAWFVIAVQAISFIIPLMLIYRQLPTHIQRFSPIRAKSIRGIAVVRWIGFLLLAAPLVSLTLHTLIKFNSETLMTLWRSPFLISLGRSVIITLTTLFLTLILAFLLRQQARWTLIVLTFSPVAVGLIWLSLVGQSLVSLCLALVMSLLPLATYLLQQGQQQLPKALMEAAQTLGANWWQRLRLEYRWLWPNIQQILAIGVVLVLGDVALASLLTPTDQPTVMQLIYGLLSSYHFAVGSLGLLIILLVILMIQLIIFHIPYGQDHRA